MSFATRSSLRRLLALALGLFTVAHSLAGSLQYSYDAMERLTRVQYPDGSAIDYVYDNLGNRLMKATAAPATPSNSPPSTVSVPSIANGATNVSTATSLGWNAVSDPNSGDGVAYFLYLGTSPAPPLVYSGWQTNWAPGGLQCFTTYYWYVVARDSHNAQTTSPLWSFTTGNTPPTPDFAPSPASGAAPLNVTFRDQTAYHCGSLVAWQWDFTNDGVTDSTNQNPSFTYSAGGDYTVRLTVRDEHGGVATVFKTNVVSVLGNNIVDLAPARLNVESAGSYGNLVVSYAVTNLGSLSVSASWHYTDRFYLSTNAVLDSAAMSLGAFYENQPLPPHSAYSRTNLVSLPDTALDNCYLLLKTDGDNQIGELNENNNVLAIALHGRLPDLVPAKLSWSGQTVAGQTINMAYAVTNQGGLSIRDLGGTPAEWADTVYLSTKAAWDTNAVWVGSGYNDLILPAGSGYAATNSVDLPACPPGNYFLILRANDDTSLVESNRANNAISLPISLSAPDLAPLALQAPATFSGPPNPSLALVWGVTNRGNGPASGMWYDAVYLSTNAMVNNDSILANDFSENGPVAPGGSYWRTNTLKVPVVRSGTYYLVFVTDAYAELGDSNPGNNTLAVPVNFTVLPPDLSVLTFQAPAAITGAPNPTVTLVWGVTNRGTGPAVGPWSDALYLSTNATLDPYASSFYGGSVPGPLPPKGAYSTTNSVQVPVVQSGAYYLIFKTDAYDDVYESDEANNTLAVPVTFTIRPPDLAVLAFQAPSTVTAGSTITLVWGVTNQGIGVAAGDWDDAAFLSTSPAWDWSATYLASTSETGPVLAGASYWRTNTAKLPSSVLGSYYLIFKTDAWDDLYESTETNNSRALPLFIGIPQGAPDLAPVSLRAPASAMAGQSIQVGCTITNHGNAVAIGPWYDALLLSTDPDDFSDAAVLTFLTPVDSVTNGASYSATNTVTLPITTDPGTYYLVLEVDYLNQLYESDKTDNTLVVPIEVLPSSGLPDLAPAFLTIPASAAPGQNIQLVYCVTNQGASTVSGTWYDMLWLSTTPTLDSPTYLGMQVVSTSLAAGGSYARTNTVKIPSTTTLGSYYVVVVTDAASQVGEANEDNNQLDVPIQIQATTGLPDLAPIKLTAPSLAMPGQPFQVTCVITNQGSASAAGPWSDQLVWSTNAAWDSYDLALATHTQTQSIAAAGGYAFTNTVTLPPWPPGTYYLVLKTDAANAVTESAETNNTLAVPVLCHTIQFAGKQLFTNGGFQMAIQGLVGTNYTLLASTNLSRWTRVLDFTCTNSATRVTDWKAPDFQRRFYRVIPLTNTPKLRLDAATPMPWTRTGLNLVLDGPLGRNFRIDASTNLVNWVPITNFGSNFVPIFFNDPASTNYKQRFYRAVTP